MTESDVLNDDFASRTRTVGELFDRIRALEAALAACRTERDQAQANVDRWWKAFHDADAYRVSLITERDAALADAAAARGALVGLTAFVRSVEKFAAHRGHGQIPNWNVIAYEAKAALDAAGRARS